MKRKRGHKRTHLWEYQNWEWLKTCATYSALFLILLLCFVVTGWLYSNGIQITTTGVIVGKDYDPSHTTTNGKTTSYDDEDFILHLRTEKHGYILVEVSMSAYYSLEIGDQITYSYWHNKWGLGGKYGESVRLLD